MIGSNKIYRKIRFYYTNDVVLISFFITIVTTELNHMMKSRILKLILIIHMLPVLAYASTETSSQKKNSIILVMAAGSGELSRDKGRVFLNLLQPQPP